MFRVLKPFELLEPMALEEALDILTTYGARAKVLAGGVDLVMRMRLRELMLEFVVSMQKIPEWDAIEFNGEGG